MDNGMYGVTMIEDDEMRMMQIIADVSDKKFRCTVKGCNESFETYDDFSRHCHTFHGIDEM